MYKKLFFAGNITGILELSATIFMMDVMWAHGFEEAKRRWQLACQWRGEQTGIRGATAVPVQPPAQPMNTSGSRPTE
jgi:hypothetical protein